MKPGLI